MQHPILDTAAAAFLIPRMIQRYSRAEMREIWSEQRKLEIWLQIELLASEALARQGLVPKKDFAQMKARAAFKLERCKELERTLNHDVIAFTTNVAENIGAPASRWLHFGLTSSDVVDTAFAVQMAQSADILIADVKALRKVDRRQGAEISVHADDRAQPRHSRRADHLWAEAGVDARRIWPRVCNGWRPAKNRGRRQAFRRGRAPARIFRRKSKRSSAESWGCVPRRLPRR